MKRKDIIKGRIYSLSIGRRISLAIIVLIIGTIVMYMGSTYLIMSHQLKKNAQAGTEKDLTMVSEKLDMFLERVKSDAILILSSDACQRLLSSSDAFQTEDSVAQYRMHKLMQETMMSILNNQSIYRSIIFHDLNGKSHAQSNAKVNAEYQKAQGEEVADFIRGISNERWLSIHKSPWVYHNQKEAADCISFLHKVYAGESGKLIGVMELEVSNGVISGLYHTLMKNDIKVFIVGDGGSIISSKEAEDLYARVGSLKWYEGLEKLKYFEDMYMFKDRKSLYFARDYQPLAWKIVCQIPQKTYTRDIRVFSVVDLLIGFFLLLFASWCSRVLILSITRPLSAVTKTIQKIGNGDYNRRIHTKDGGEIGTLSYEFNRMIDKTGELMRQIVETQEKKRESELELIQLQMTPHFFYNILESICGLIIIDDKKTAIKTINLLSSFYRGVLNKGKDIIEINMELDIARNYLEIMKICYPGKFTYEIECSEELNHYHMNKLTLQPILENAIHHGIIAASRQGQIRIRAVRLEGYLEIRVSDNGCGLERHILDEWKKGSEPRYHMDSFGLRNTDERIKLYFGKEYGLNILSEENKGTEIIITLPLE